MASDLKVQTSILIDAPKAKVWDALINPALIKKYLFGTNAISDWEVGSSLVFQGEYEGTTYQDKGTILQIEPEKILQYTYLSSFSGLADLPENYSIVTMELSDEKVGVLLSITQSNYQDEERLQHAKEGWKSTLQLLKKIVEEG